MKTDPPPVSFRDLSGAQSAPNVDPSVRARLLDAYRPWRKIKYIATDLKLDPTQAWTVVKAERASSWLPIGIHRAEGGTFGYVFAKQLMEPLHTIDRALNVAAPFENSDSRTARVLRERWSAIVKDSESAPIRIGARTLMEEAAESSIMEGAATTRREAIEMLRAGRPPVNRGERMVLNNYQAMQQVKEWLGRPLSIELLLELQDLITDGTLDDATAGGRLRTPAEAIRVVDSRDESVVFVPPHADSLPRMLDEVCRFANAEHVGDQFIHPLVKACILHFLIGYAHPFVDGNGRTARAIFYWASLRSGYHIFEYLTISEIIRKGFARYPQAYLDSELDDGDLTYFILYKLGVVTQALEYLGEHLKSEHERIARSEALLAVASNLNVRQRLVLDHGLRHPLTQYTAKSHSNSNGISLMTARTDLENLVARGFMTTSKRGREVIYHVVPNLERILTRATT